MKHVGFVALLIFTLVAVSAPQGQRRSGQNRPAAAFDAGPRVFDTTEYRIRVVNVAGGLSYPYCLAFLPDGSMLVAELEGRLRRIRDGALIPEPIGGMPKVYYAAGQAGLMDIALHPNFAQNHFVYFTYNKPGEKGATMAIGRGAFDGTQLTGVYRCVGHRRLGKRKWTSLRAHRVRPGRHAVHDGRRSQRAGVRAEGNRSRG